MKLMISAVASYLILFTAVASHAEETVTVGAGKMKLGALLQTWAVDDTTAPADADLNFRMRRAEFKLSGSVHPDTRFFMMVDAAKSPSLAATGDNKILQDFGIGFTLFENFELVAGQFKIPTLAEGFASSSELMLPERSNVARAFGDRREPGLMVDYNPSPVRVRLMVSNGRPDSTTFGAAPGAATNVNETDSSKDVNGRVDWTIAEGFKLGAFGSNSQSAGGNSFRTGGDFEYSCPKVVARLSGVSAKEASLSKTAMAVEGGYNINDRFQAAARFENFQVTTAPKSSSRAITVGVSYFIDKHNLKLQLAHTVMDHMTSASTTSVDGSYKPGANNAGSLTILALQTAL